ncbi:hypothetical protein CEXT_573471 [Caerostris extrusa]|uniref:Uncharacterized protein n=1 Tax=Caerostris extrusa TaxID=172846 RepID=A0AAV4MT35_CAEEX|nr:hypothetical protein CEXT_573471 [Caerostris extrusa]
MVRYKDELKDKIAEISNQHKEDITINLAGEQLKIFPANSDVHRAIARYLTEQQLEYYVITPKKQRPLKAVLKILFASDSISEL